MKDIIELKDKNLFVTKDGRVFKQVGENTITEIPQRTSNGYKYMCYNSKAFAVHRLVAEAFLSDFGKISDWRKYNVDHIDNDKENNNAENLQIITKYDNVVKAHSFYHSVYKINIVFSKQKGLNAYITEKKQIIYSELNITDIDKMYNNLISFYESNNIKMIYFHQQINKITNITNLFHYYLNSWN